MNEQLLEIFLKRKKEVKSTVGDYNGHNVRMEVLDIYRITNRLLKSKYRKFLNKGLIAIQRHEVFDERDSEFWDNYVEYYRVYEPNHAFKLYKYDLGKCMDALPRTDNRPLNIIIEDINKEISKYIELNYKGKYKVENFGNLDSGEYGIVLN